MQHVAQSAGLHHFKFKLGRPDARMRREQRAEAIDKLNLLQLHGAHIHAHRNLEALILPCFHLCERRFNHPLANIDGKRMVFNDGQEARLAPSVPAQDPASG